MSANPVRIKLTITTMFSATARKSTTVEVDRGDWEEMSRDEQERYIKEATEEFVSDQIDVGVKFENEADDPER